MKLYRISLKYKNEFVWGGFSLFVLFTFFSILDFEFLISVQIGFKGQSKTLGPKWGTQLGVPIWVL